STPVNYPNTAVTQMKASTHKRLQTVTSLVYGKTVQVQMSLNGKVTCSQVLEEEMTSGMGSTFNILPTCNQVNSAFPSRKFGKKLQRLVLPVLNSLSLEGETSRQWFATPSQVQNIGHGPLKKLVIGKTV